MEVQPWQRRLAIAVLAASLFLTGFSLGVAVTGPAGQSAWVRFGQPANSAGMVLLMSLVLLPTGHRARSWLWAGLVGTFGFALTALIAGFAQLS